MASAGAGQSSELGVEKAAPGLASIPITLISYLGNPGL
jgi:hypothetical protein